MRCVALADALRDQGVRVEFAMIRPSAFAIQTLEARGFCIRELSENESRFDQSGADAIVAIMNVNGFDEVLIDHYDANGVYFATMSDSGKQVFAIDDEAVRDFSRVDWILNPNPGVSASEYNVASGGDVLVGPQYALIRREFSAMRDAPSPESSQTDQPRILMQFGGGDTRDLCAKILNWLENIPKVCSIRCIIAGDAWQSGNSRHDVSVLDNVSDIAEHIKWADVAIGAGGSSCWELCCLGVPMVIGELSPDQSRIAAELHRKGAAIHLGSWHTVSESMFTKAIADLIEDAPKRSQMSRVGRELVDGLGANRGAKSIANRLPACPEVTA